MSRSNNTVLINPATKFLEWDSEKACFEYWDKEKKANVTVKLPIRGYVLDELATVKGYSNKTQNGIWSNEVKDITKQSLSVKSKDKSGKLTVIAEGKWSDIKEIVKAGGGKYTRSLYFAMLNDKEEYEIVNLQLKGAAFSGWLNFVNENKNAVLTAEIVCADFTKEKNGATKYTIPVFTAEEASEEGNKAAIELDIELQVYLREYFDKTQNATEYVEDTVTSSAIDELPF